MYLQTSELICECLDIVDVIEQVDTLLYLAHKIFVTNKKHIGQTVHFVNVVKGLSRLCRSFIAFDGASWLSAKLRPMMEKAFFMHLWYSFSILGSIFKNGVSSYLSTMFQISIDSNNILNFERLKFYRLNLSMT